MPNPYLLGARRQWLRFTGVERIGIWPVLWTWNWQRLGNLPSIRVYWFAYPRLNQGKWVSPLVHSTQVGLRGGPAKIIVSSNKKTKRNLSESDSENEAADFSRFIAIESLEEVCLAKFSPFLIEKVMSTGAPPKLLWKQGMGTCLSRWTAGDRQKTLKIKTFHSTKCRAYLHEKLNTSKGVIRSRELALATEEVIASALGKQEATNIRRISIRKGQERI